MHIDTNINAIFAVSQKITIFAPFLEKPMQMRKGQCLFIHKFNLNLKPTFGQQIKVGQYTSTISRNMASCLYSTVFNEGHVFGRNNYIALRCIEKYYVRITSKISSSISVTRVHYTLDIC